VDAAGPDEYAAYVRAEIAKWGKVIKDSNLKLEQ
jgi:tripartite-type tricarboxylate transporter receptor subunit TctC